MIVVKQVFVCKLSLQVLEHEELPDTRRQNRIRLIKALYECSFHLTISNMMLTVVLIKFLLFMEEAFIFCTFTM